MKIIFIDKSSWWGGAEECLLSMAQYFTAIPVYDVQILSAYPQAHHQPYNRASVSLKYRHSSLKYWMAERYKKPLRGLDRLGIHIKAKALSKLLGQERADIVYFNTLRNRDRWDILSAKNNGAKVIGHVRGLMSQVPVTKDTLDLCDGVICISDIVLDQVKATGTSAQLIRIYDGVDPARFSFLEVGRSEYLNCIPAVENKLLIVYPAVLEPRKGQDFAINSLPEILKVLPDAHLVIAGSEPSNSGYAFEEQLKSLVSQLNIENAVTFLGHCDDMKSFYGMADIVLALSHDGEAYGRVPVEAGIAGKPVIATGLGATPELIIDGETGILVKPKNTQKLRNAVLKLSNSDYRQAMGMKAKAHIEEAFSFEKGLLEIESFLKKIVDRAHY